MKVDLTKEHDVLRLFAENGFPDMKVERVMYGKDATPKTPDRHNTQLFNEQFDELIDLEIYFNSINLDSKPLSVKIGILPLEDPKKFVTTHLMTSRTMLGHISATPYLRRLQQLKEYLITTNTTTDVNS